MKILSCIPVTTVGGPEEREGLEEGVVVVLVEPQDVHDDFFAVRGHGRLQVLLSLGEEFQAFSNFAVSKLC